MALFAWSDDLSVGNSFIDGDHKKLITMINNFHDAMEQGRGNDVVGKVLNNLVIYTKSISAARRQKCNASSILDI